MRLLLLSDIHGNLEALEAALDAAPEYDRVANLGDVVGYGASPNQTVELVRAMEPINVRGNHDRACCGLEDPTNFNPAAADAVNWTREELGVRNIEWLRELPQGPVQDAGWRGVQFVHGSPIDEDIYIHSESSAGAALMVSATRITFFGHTHVQGAFGRTARENGDRGTDHGHASVMFVMGGAVRGGKMYGHWPGLANEQLHEQRDLALTTDFRQVMAEAVAKQLGNPRMESIFPGFRNPGVLHLLG